MSSCGSCGADLPDGARFCPTCGAPIAATAEPRTEERRVVTILFVDLVGFTERSDQADPEDVRRRLVPFHSSVKEDLERFGGTLDKFIGDAVMGVFGAPVAHEDDPLRAVRAGMRILSSMGRLRRDDPGLSVRVAVHTGEAVVAFGSGPQVGEAVAGDVVNTASRMQALAPTDSMVVGESTLRAVRERFEVEALAPAMVKGKADPLRVWRIVAERPDAAHGAPTPPFVGREQELALLAASFDRAAELGTIETVTLLGEPGLGKTRLVEELERRLGDRAHRLTGRCLPYGEGVTFAAISDVVRTLAGIAASDRPPDVRAKLSALVGRLADAAEERDWAGGVLTSLLGADRDGDVPISAGEIAEAWVRALSAATDRPLLLVLEDLHWADDALIDVVEVSAGLLSRRSILLVITARTEFLERHPRWTGSRTIALQPLGAEETGRLVASMADEFADAVRDAVAARAGGNPLYAVEFARMLGEAATSSAGDLRTPDTVRAVIGARLDAIPAELRAVVHDASVLGVEFWPEALAVLGGRPETEVRASVLELARRGIFELRASPALSGEGYGFAHSLIGEVAYGRLPRRERARRHLAAGEWLERETVELGDGFAESLARHYSLALEAAEAAGEGAVVDAARPAALRWSLAAGERAAAIDPTGAFVYFDRALGLASRRTRERVSALLRSAGAARRSGTLDAADVLARYEEAAEIARELGDSALLGEVLVRVGSQLGAMGETARSSKTLAEAVRTLEGQSQGPTLALAYAYRAEEEMFAGHIDESRALAERALSLVEAPDEVMVMSLHIRGDARCALGDPGGLEDLREALRLAERSRHAPDIVASHSYLADWIWPIEGPAAALGEYEAAIELAERRGVESQGTYAKGGSLGVLYELGEWDRLLALADEVLDVPYGRLDPAISVVARSWRSLVLLARGRGDEVVGIGELVEVGRQVEELHALAPALVVGAASAAARDPDTAIGYLEEWERATAGVSSEYRGTYLATAVRIALAVGAPELAVRLVEGCDAGDLRDRLQVLASRAALAEAAGEDGAADAYADAAARWRAYGHVFEEAMALLGRSRCLSLAGLQGEARRDRARTQELFAILGVPTTA